MAVVGMTDGVWQGGSVTRTLRRGPCRASRHDRGRRKTPRAPRLTLPTNPRSYLLSAERHLPRMVPAASTASRCEACSGVPAATCARYRRRARLWNICRRVEQRGAHQAFSLTAMIILRPARAEKGLVRTGTSLGRPPLVRTGITPVIPESEAPPPYAILKPPVPPMLF